MCFDLQLVISVLCCVLYSLFVVVTVQAVCPPERTQDQGGRK